MAIEFGSRKEPFPNYKKFETTLAGRPFVVAMAFPGSIPNTALIFTGPDGAVCCCTISMSGKDGSLLLSESAAAHRAAPQFAARPFLRLSNSALRWVRWLVYNV